MSNDSRTVEVLVLRLTEGDEGVLANLFSHYRDRLKRMVEFRLDRRLQGREDPSDVLQEAYLDARQRVRHYIDKPKVSFFLWLRQVTLQRLIDVHRRHLGAKMRDAKQEISLDQNGFTAETSAAMAAQIVGHLTSPSGNVMRAELLDHVGRALQNMDAIDREVLALCHFEELTNNEVAESLGITKAAASNRYMRALSRLRSVLDDIPGFFGDSDSR